MIEWVYRLFDFMLSPSLQTVSRKDFQHLALQLLADTCDFGIRKIRFADAEQVIIELEFLQHHLGMKNVFLADVHVDCLVALAGIV